MAFPSVSVVIPTYNRAKTIIYCLDSVCNQTYPPKEVIVVDDCSTDATVDIVNKYSQDHPSVRCVVLEINSGAQAARNRGIMEASNGWIAFQDSDDEWISDKLEKQITALENVNFNPLTVVHSDGWLYDYADGIKYVWNIPFIDGSVFTDLLKSPGPLFPTILTSKIALLQIGLLDENVPSYQEWDTAIRLARICRFIHIREPLFIYHLHSGDAISKENKRGLEGYQYVLDKHREEIIHLCGIRILNQHLANNALNAMRIGYYSDALQILEKAVGKSMRIVVLKWVAKGRINLWLYSLLASIVRKVKLIL